MALDPEAMDAAVLGNLQAKTGRPLADWLAALEAAGPFAKPTAAVAWLKAQGMGHVTAQIVLRQWRPSGQPPTVEDVLGPAGAVLFGALVAQLAPVLPGLRIGVRQGYVTLGTVVQFAVAVRAPGGKGVSLGLVAQAAGAPLQAAPPMGGSGRFRLRLDLADAAGIPSALAHLRAAAGSQASA